MYQSKRYWDSIKLIKVDNLEPLEIVPLEDQHKQAKILEPETKVNIVEAQISIKLKLWAVAFFAALSYTYIN